MGVSGILAIVGFIYTYGKFVTDNENQTKRLDKQDIAMSKFGEEINEAFALIEGFHGKCNIVENQLGNSMTKEQLIEHCSRNQKNCTSRLCSKQVKDYNQVS